MKFSWGWSESGMAAFERDVAGDAVEEQRSQLRRKKPGPGERRELRGQA